MKILAGVSLSLLMLLSVALADAPCTCAEDKLGGGWCEAHDRGHVAGIEIRSHALFDALDPHGHDIDESLLDCDRCRLARKSGGFCATHNRGFVDGRAYGSKLSYHLAAGRRLEDPDAIACPVCRKNATSHGWCAKCRKGMVGAIEIDGRAAFVETDRALHLLLEANKTAPQEKSCTCAPAEPLGRWCEQHRVAWVAGLRLTSWELYEALDAHGHEMQIEMLSCSACKRAHAEDGFCEEHRIGFIDGLAYLSALTYSLAKGEIKEPSAISCPLCRKNAETHGWCPTHARGMVGRVELRNEGDYRRAAEAYARLLRARRTAERCEVCAAVMMMDGTCRTHDATYKDGELLDR